MNSLSRYTSIALGLMALGTALYFANAERICRTHESDYLNAIDEVVSNNALQQVDRSEEFEAMVEHDNEQAWDRAAAAFGQLRETCGERRMKAAHRRANEMILRGP